MTRKIGLGLLQDSPGPVVGRKGSLLLWIVLYRSTLRGRNNRECLDGVMSYVETMFFDIKQVKKASAVSCPVKSTGEGLEGP